MYCFILKEKEQKTMTDKLKELLGLLEERLVQHDESRKEVQSQLQKVSAQELGDADSLEEKINEEVRKDFDPRAARISSIIDKIANENTNFDSLIKEAQEELSTEYKYEIQHSKYENKFVNSYKLNIIPVTKEQKFDFASIDDMPQKCRVSQHIWTSIWTNFTTRWWRHKTRWEKYVLRGRAK